jgi:hypothetical protein
MRNTHAILLEFLFHGHLHRLRSESSLNSTLEKTMPRRLKSQENDERKREINAKK